MASEVQVYNNFLDKTIFNELKKILLKNDNFPYFFIDHKIDEGDGFPQFVHQFYYGQTINSEYYHLLDPILDKLNPLPALFCIRDKPKAISAERLSGSPDMSIPVASAKSAL